MQNRRRGPILSRIPHCSIVPPHLLRALADRGEGEDRSRAKSALALSAQPRRERQVVATVAGLILVPRRAKHRTICDARNGRELPGVIVRTEGARRTGDPAVDEAYEFSGKTYDYFRRVHGRRSLDDRGMRLESSVHYGERFNNAHWNGRQMIFGDGDGKYFRRFTSSLDVVAHELTHGLTHFASGLGATGQSGALAEHISDVFAVLVKQYFAKQTAAEADWLVGAELFTENVSGMAIRSLRAPGTAYDDAILGRDPQPAHMRDYVRTRGDDGGVHINSGIPNHAFYVAATLLGGHAWDVPGRIWYRALTRELGPRSRFRDCAGATVRAAAELYGPNSEPQQAVRAGWARVGIDVEAGRGAKARAKAPRATFDPPAPGAEVPLFVV